MSRRVSLNEFIHRRPVFERILFAQCWEDPAVDSQALQVGEGDSVLSVTSGGCNTLALALPGPSRVLAVDLNSSQNHLLALKIAALRVLDPSEMLELAGAVPSDRREKLYEACRPWLLLESRFFWEEHRQLIRGGLLGCGRYERYLNLFRKILLLIHGRRTLEALFEERDREGRERFFREHWDTPTWRTLFRVFFSRTVLGRAGLDPSFFTFVDDIGGFGEHFLRLARHAMVDLEPRKNPFLAWIMLRRFPSDESLPLWLRPELHGRLRQNVDRIEIMTAELGEALALQPGDSIDAFNFSNVFEWVSSEAFSALHDEIHRVGRDGARLCYRNLLVRRSTPAGERERYTRDPEHAARLLEADRSFVYRHLEVASVVKADASLEERHGFRAHA